MSLSQESGGRPGDVLADLLAFVKDPDASAKLAEEKQRLDALARTMAETMRECSEKDADLIQREANYSAAKGQLDIDRQNFGVDRQKEMARLDGITNDLQTRETSVSERERTVASDEQNVRQATDANDTASRRLGKLEVKSTAKSQRIDEFLQGVERLARELRG